jgi:UDP-GlcNAc:undecaprenyl-phosphate GlcNAc-1-phosphate transferase
VQMKLLAVFAGALLGFLIFNFNPASIFMGDSGSLFVGFSVAVLALNYEAAKPRDMLTVLSVPVMLLAIPILDTTFVTLRRRLSGRPVSMGGRDHTSHELVAIGLSERKAVLILYFIAVLSGLLSMLVRDLPIYFGLAIIPIFVLSVTLLAIYLSGAVKKSPAAKIEGKDVALLPLLAEITYKRRLFEVMLDLLLISISYYSAYILRFEKGQDLGVNLQLMLKSLPLIIIFKSFSFFAFGVYRGMWRYAGLDDMLTFIKAMSMGTILSIIALVLAFRFEGFSRTVFIIDWVLLFILVAGSRLSYKLFDRYLKPLQAGGERTLIYGAGDGGEFALRELLNNEELGMTPVGFIDDDAMKNEVKIHGYPVLGASSDVERLVKELEATRMIVSSPKIQPEKYEYLKKRCSELGVKILHFRMTLEE